MRVIVVVVRHGQRPRGDGGRATEVQTTPATPRALPCATHAVMAVVVWLRNGMGGVRMKRRVNLVVRAFLVGPH